MNLFTNPTLSLYKTILRLKLLFIFPLFSFSALCQDNNEIACNHANQLKNGSLIVVLETQSKKLALLEKLSIKPSSSEKEKIKYAKLFKSEIDYRDTLWHYTTLGFTQLYHYSKVFFIMDTSLRCFIEHPTTCKYYNSILQPLESVPSGSIYVAQYDHIFENQGTNLSDAWYVMDNKLRRLSSPFPEQIKFTFFNPSFFYKLPKSILKENHIKSIKSKNKPLLYAYKLDKLLNKFYKKAGRCSD